MPAVRSYTVTKTIETKVRAETPAQAVEMSTNDELVPDSAWETTSIEARKDF